MASFEKKIADAVFDLQNRGFGSVAVISTSVVSGKLSATTFNITQASVNGELLIEDIILKTDATGLATSSTLKIVNDNVKGTSVIMEAAVGDLGGRVTFDLARARRDSLRYNIGAGNGANSQGNCSTILESGRRIGLITTGSASTGLGKIDVYIKFRRLAANADMKIA